MIMHALTTTIVEEPLPPYNLSRMPAVERVMALIDYWCHKDIDTALQRFAKYGLPPVAMQDMIFKHDFAYRDHFSKPENRACNKPRKDWHIVATVLARGGSKGLPGKALRCVGGIPLIVHAINKCNAIRDIKRIIVNTDSPEIAAVAREAGAETPFLRPAELATDTASSAHAAVFGRLWLSLIEGQQFDFYVVVSATHPLFDGKELNLALDAMADRDATTLESVATPPTFNREYYTLEENILTPVPLPLLPNDQATYAQCGAFSITARGPYYHLYGPFLAKARKEFPRPTAMAWPLPAEQCVDIDVETDLCLAEEILAAGRKSTFETLPIRGPANGAKCKPVSARIHINDSSNEALGFVRVLFYASGGKPQRWEGRPLPCQLIRLLATLGNGSLYLAGHGTWLSELANRHMLPLIDTGRWDHPDQRLFTILRQYIDCEGIQKPILLVDGRAAALKQKSLETFLELAQSMRNVPLCSVSRPPVHPAHLKWVSEDGPYPVCNISGKRRQDLTSIWCRDGVLTWLPLEETRLPFSHGMQLPEAEGKLVENEFDSFCLQTLNLNGVHHARSYGSP